MKDLTSVKLISALILIVGVVSGCGSAGSGSTEMEPSLGGGTPVVLTEKSGSGFGCFILSREAGSGEILYCSGNNATLSINSATPIPYVETDTTFSAFEVWDDTVCVVTSVAERPLSRNVGSALYCFGEASLGFNYFSYDLIYSGPNFTTAAHGSAGLTYLTEPFVGGEESMDLMTNTGGNWLVMLDGSGAVSSATLSCDKEGATLTCPDFSVVLQ